MACPKCPNCGEQMVEERAYTVGRVCKCPECGQRKPYPEGPLGPKEGKSLKPKWLKTVEDAFDMKSKEK